jgi:hypothetical protein
LIKIKSLAGDLNDMATPALRAHFTMARFKTALVDWIVADDQVSLIVTDNNDAHWFYSLFMSLNALSSGISCCCCVNH